MMTKNLHFDIANLMILEATMLDKTEDGKKICIPIRNIMFFLEGRNPMTNEACTAIFLEPGREIPVRETIDKVLDQYNNKVNYLMQNLA